MYKRQIVHIADFSDLERIAKTVPEDARKLSDAFWPGPLTMIAVSYTHLDVYKRQVWMRMRRH